MVTKRRMLDETIGPPPMDESWWESVLAEEAAQSVVRPAKYVRHAASSEHVETNHDDLSDLVSLDWKKATELYDQDQVIEAILNFKI